MGRNKKNKNKTPKKQKSTTPAVSSQESNSIPPKQSATSPKNSAAIQARAISLQHYQGPLPHPSILVGFDSLCPGEGKRILDQFHKQSDHRMEIEKIVVKQGSRDSLLGVIFAFVIACAGLYFGYDIVVKGNPIVGTILGGAPCVGLASAFIYGTRVRSKERQLKHKKNP